jgi:hypothetical protein
MAASNLKVATQRSPHSGKRISQVRKVDDGHRPSPLSPNGQLSCFTCDSESTVRRGDGLVRGHGSAHYLLNSMTGFAGDL